MEPFFWPSREGGREKLNEMFRHERQRVARRRVATIAAVVVVAMMVGAGLTFAFVRLIRWAWGS